MTKAQYERYWQDYINRRRFCECGAEKVLDQRIEYRPGVTGSFWRCPKCDE